MLENGPSILIVDDNRAALAGLERDLAPLGVRLLMLQDGHQLLDRVRVDKPDVVLLDALLPGLSGFDLCKQIKMTPDVKNTLVVILTGVYVKEQYREDAINQFKADGFLTKPCRPTELQRQMLRLLAKKYKTTPADFQRALKSKSKEGLVLPPAVAPPAPLPKRGWLDRLLGRKAESEAPAPTGGVLQLRSAAGVESETALEEAPGEMEFQASEAEAPQMAVEPAPVGESSAPPGPPASEAPSPEENFSTPVEEVLYVADESPAASPEPAEIEASTPAAVPEERVSFFPEGREPSFDQMARGASDGSPGIAGALPPVEAVLAEPPNGPASAADVSGTTVPQTLFAPAPAITPGLPVFPESAFFSELKRELRRSHRSRKPLTLILIRVEDLAQIAELFGQETKQRVLSHIAELAVETAREVDMAGLVLSLELVGLAAFACDRYGGGRIFGRILKANSRRPFSVGEAIPAIIPALRFGMATYPTDAQELEGLVSRAREELAET